jgi:hypothetical protein
MLCGSSISTLNRVIGQAKLIEIPIASLGQLLYTETPQREGEREHLAIGHRFVSSFQFLLTLKGDMIEVEDTTSNAIGAPRR